MPMISGSPEETARMAFPCLANRPIAYAVLNNVVKDIPVQCYTLPQNKTEYGFRRMVDILMKNAGVLHCMTGFDTPFCRVYVSVNARPNCPGYPDVSAYGGARVHNCPVVCESPCFGGFSMVPYRWGCNVCSGIFVQMPGYFPVG